MVKLWWFASAKIFNVWRALSFFISFVATLTFYMATLSICLPSAEAVLQEKRKLLKDALIKLFGKKYVDKPHYAKDKDWRIDYIGEAAHGEEMQCHCTTTIKHMFQLSHNKVPGVSAVIGSKCMTYFDNPAIVVQAKAVKNRVVKEKKRKREGVVCKRCKVPLMDLRIPLQRDENCCSVECYSQHVGDYWRKNLGAKEEEKVEKKLLLRNNKGNFFCLLCGKDCSQRWQKICSTCYKNQKCSRCGFQSAKKMVVKKRNGNYNRVFSKCSRISCGIFIWHKTTIEKKNLHQ